MATCNHCGSSFKDLFKNNNTQAMGCSADIFHYKGELCMMGHYGSRIVDGDLYKVLTDKYKEGIICDACIQEGLNAGDFERISHSNYFGLK